MNKQTSHLVWKILLLTLVCWPIHAFSQKSDDKMKIEIWSDVACPFCYIGQAHLRSALADFPEKEEVEIVWKSFILDPTLPEKTDQNLFESLSERKGMPMPQVMQMTARVAQMGQLAGLKMDFEHVKPVSTLKAHRLIQLAKEQQLGDEMERRLFQAYFEEGADLSNVQTLTNLGVAVGLNAVDIAEALYSDAYAGLVAQDVQEARNLGIGGVPYFRLDGKYGISGGATCRGATRGDFKGPRRLEQAVIIQHFTGDALRSQNFFLAALKN